MKFLDLKNNVFGRLTVIGISHKNKHGQYMWKCLCDCSNSTIVSSNDLRQGKTVSCGCQKLERTIARNTSHAQSKTSEYRSWKAIKTRCYNKNVKSYADYGARGIIMCDRWLASFKNFIVDMGLKPDPSYSIDRIDHNGNYTPENCRWASKKQQNRNTRQNHLIKTDWGLLPISEASEKSGVPLSTIKARLKRGVKESELLK